MCGTCGCSSTNKVTITNLESGLTTTLDRGVHDHDHDHDHDHVHEDGTRHSHPHSHGHDDGHDDDHHHDHDHGHGHGAHDHRHHHHSHEHTHADGAAHSHPHVHGHEHEHGEGTTVVSLEARLLAKNDALAERNRAWFAGREILALNLVSSPGSGKTMLLERMIRDLGREMPIAVIEGDQATANDSERIQAAGAPCVQVNTGTGCHLEADMIARGLAELKPPVGAVVLIENVGNLVCPALFDLGEHAKVAILSVTEGEDKPLKYPHMFQASRVVLLNKIDLVPHLDFDVDKAIENARKVNPDIAVFRVSARTGEGLQAWYDWIREQAAAVRTSPI
ncbi:MAG: hydrogenase nickel incorporation protein HypB [Hyphomicrobium sp.]|uniref:hydrogenase nickel incorporation protein HypB n=1 Tax=Hyphomicrobium sp. TaxID=82 RepID=UPI003D0B1F61